MSRKATENAKGGLVLGLVEGIRSIQNYCRRRGRMGCGSDVDYLIGVIYFNRIRTNGRSRQMSEFDRIIELEQTPFDDVDFAENPEPRCPCVLLLDTSGSMDGRPIEELNAGLMTFRDALAADPMAKKRVEIAIVTFGPVEVVQPFISAEHFTPVHCEAHGATPIGEAIEEGLRLIEERKSSYRSHGVAYYRPWMFLITDGAPTDEWTNAASQVKVGEAAKKLSFFAVGVEGADINTLAEIATRTPLKLKGLEFRELFRWLSNSLSSVSQSQPGDTVRLPPPEGWAEI